MRKNAGEGTKIAQAAKELNVTSVTIRRYITEFNIQTTSDENGIKVLPPQAMEDLHEIRKLKDEGLTNPKVLELLEERRSKPAEEKKEKEPVKKAVRKIEAPARTAVRKSAKAAEPAKPAKEEEPEEEQEPEEEPVARPAKRGAKARPVVVEEEAEDEPEDEEAESEGESDSESDSGSDVVGGEGRTKHTLTCQTCQKVFEHMNPRLRDCLDCYRVKRKERRRGGDKHKNVIQNPLAQQVLSKNQQQQERQTAVTAVAQTAPALESRPEVAVAARVAPRETISFAPAGTQVYRQPVRSYRKAIEETRQITSNLKRRLERPDLPESDRRFLEQIYAYQLILHQGWKHLAEYRSGGTSSGGGSSGGSSDSRGERGERGERPDRTERTDRADRSE